MDRPITLYRAKTETEKQAIDIWLPAKINKPDGSHDLIRIVDYARDLEPGEFVHLTKASLYGLAAETAMLDLWDLMANKLIYSSRKISLKKINRENSEDGSNLSKSIARYKLLEFGEKQQLIKKSQKVSDLRDKIIHQALNKNVTDNLNDDLNELDQKTRELLFFVNQIIKNNNLSDLSRTEITETNVPTTVSKFELKQ